MRITYNDADVICFMGKHKSTTEQKIQWLVEHPDVWKGWPGVEGQDALIIEAMMKDGLISTGSNHYDVQDFGKIIGEARSRIRKGNK